MVAIAVALGAIVFYGAAYAEPSGATAATLYNDVVILGRNEAAIATVAVSTSTSALGEIVASRPTRAFVDIINVSGNSVSIGVTSSTQTVGHFTLADTKALSDVFPGLTGYTGAIYGKAASTEAVKVLEVY